MAECSAADVMVEPSDTDHKSPTTCVDPPHPTPCVNPPHPTPEDLWDDSDDDEEWMNQVDLSEAGIEKARQEQEKAPSEPSIVPMSRILSDDRNPLRQLRGGYLWVSDMVSQNWCEHQLVYKLTLPGLVVEEPALARGSDLHLARELEVQDYVQIEVTSSEDIFAVKVINLLTSVLELLTGSAVCREVPIFGAPFNKDIFFMGMIDEIRCDPETMQLELVELKTRTFKSLPSAAQRNSHKVQTMLYKRLFDDLVQGKISKDKICSSLKLDSQKEFGESILKQINDVKKFSQPMRNLDELLQHLLDTMQSLTCIEGILLEYCYQKDHSTIGFDQVVYEEAWFTRIYENYADFWMGRREPCGVEIEEAWKCQKCDFADVCEWRDRKSRTAISKNK